MSNRKEILRKKLLNNNKTTGYNKAKGTSSKSEHIKPSKNESEEQKKLVKEINLPKKSKKSVYTRKKKKTKFDVKKVTKISILFLGTIFFAVLIIIFLFNQRCVLVFLFEEYKTGELVNIGNTKWYVISDSNAYNQSVELLSQKPIDINNDGKLDDNDKKNFDIEGKYNYNTKNKNNIGYFLNNELKKSLNITGIKSIRLLSSEEYIYIRNQMNFGYDWKEGNWLANEEIGEWWLDTIKYNKVYIVTERGSYKLDYSDNKNFVRPVISVDKSYVNKFIIEKISDFEEKDI
ncbi:MAG: hypothetical protein ACI4OG_02965 [Bacilli bacterium]